MKPGISFISIDLPDRHLAIDRLKRQGERERERGRGSQTKLFERGQASILFDSGSEHCWF